MLYVVKYSGPFGFIKPWTAVRDEETFSQQFLTPSIVAGIERKLFPELLQNDKGDIQRIASHRLSYSSISQQKEVTQTRGVNSVSVKGVGKIFTRGSIKDGNVTFAPLNRGVMVNPILFLAFNSCMDAERASRQHICLARNEDILYPDEQILQVTQEEFDTNDELFAGFELVFEKNEQSFLVGYNRLKQSEPMYGYIKIVGQPVKNNF